MNNKYFIIFLIAIFLIYIVFPNKITNNLNKELFNQKIEVSQDADNILKNLSTDDAKKLLVSNDFLMPWVKNMEENEAELLYNKLFVDFENKDLKLSDIIYGKKDKDGNVIVEPIKGVDLDISKSNMLKNDVDIYEYNELVKFIEKSSFEEIREWGQKFGFDYILDENKNILGIHNPSLNEIKKLDKIILSLPEKRITIENKKYAFMLPKIGSDDDTFDPSTLTNNDYNLEFPNTFPSNLKYRVRNNKTKVQNALSNIINSYGMKQGLDWKKTIKNGKVIINTTMNPNTILNIRKSKLLRIKNLNINNIQRPKRILGIKCLNLEEARQIYSNLLDITNNTYDSDESYLPRKIVNSKQQILVDDKTENGEELMQFMKILKLDNIYNILDESGNIIKSNFAKSPDDILGLPWVFKDPEPFEWDKSKEEAMNIPHMQLIRKKIDKNKKIIELNDEEKKNILNPGQIIYGPNNRILCKVELEIITDTDLDEVVEKNIIYLDSSNNKYSIPDITKDISWKLEDLKLMFDNTDNTILKEQIALINKLIVIRSKAIKNKKVRSIDYLREHKNSVKNIIKLSLNDDSKEECVLDRISDLLSDYSLIQTPNNPIYTLNDIKPMNRKNLVSIIENGLQEIERTLIYNKCLEKASYPNGFLLLDIKKNKIKFISREDILRMQRAIYGSFNKSISIEDNLDDIVYATSRIKIMLKNKRDKHGIFITKNINNQIEKELVEQTIQIIDKISFIDILIDENYKININNITSDAGLTLEALNNLYQYISIDVYFSVPLDLTNNTLSFDDSYSKIINNNEWSYEEKTRANNAIDSLKNRTISMLDEKKIIILDQIKKNIINRHILDNKEDNIIKDHINNNITVDTLFSSIKNYTFKNIIIDNSTEGIDDSKTTIENFNLLRISGYNDEKYHKY